MYQESSYNYGIWFTAGITLHDLDQDGSMQITQAQFIVI